MKNRRSRKGLLFVLEGIDGSGKTAVAELVVTRLTEEGYDAVKLHEPTSESEWGRQIRDRSPRGGLSPAEELELFVRDREWHVRNRIRPALNAGKIIVLDRYFFANGAYQSASTGIHWREILRRNREGIHPPEPDLVFVLDVPVETGLARVLGREYQSNEQFEKIERLVKVRQAYLEMAHEDAGLFEIVDATQTLEQVADQVHRRILEFLGRKGRKTG
ncbi:MAG: dTMP kinase [Candidatus Thorarchaeota archaeon]|nr:MAG: dTMP kinase [Candidatus Thorarchaeota archaeon]